MVKLKKKTLLIIVLICIIFITFICCTIFSIININSSKILNGISINGIDVSNMTKEEAIEIISKLVDNKVKSNIKIYYDEDIEQKNEMSYETSVEISTLEAEYDINTAVQEAYNIGKIANIFENNFNILNVLINNKDIKLNLSINEKNLEKIITNISSNLPNKLIQSSYYIENKNLIITKGTKGNIIKKDEFKQSLFNILNDFQTTTQDIFVPIDYANPKDIDIEAIYKEVYKEPQDAYYENTPFKIYKEVQGIKFDKEKAKKVIAENPEKTEYKIKLEYTKAKTKLEDLDIDIFQDLLGSYSTRYDERNKDRTNNLNLAADKIDSIILSPGEEFSYNKIVGKRTIAAGYKESKIYSNGQVVDGLGGGICQISSTLYNAVVFANLNITERHNHQFITSYVDSGRDATVAYGSKDFKFVNNRTYPIKIKMSVAGGIAKVDIYGIKEETEYNINFDVEIVSTIEYATKYKEDKSLKTGQEKIKQLGANGQSVKVYKVMKKNGIEVSRELISQDTYSALNKVVLMGTGNE